MVTRRSPSKIVNLMIDEGIYCGLFRTGGAQFMCVAITIARDRGLINFDEYRSTREAIRERLIGYPSLEQYLSHPGRLGRKPRPAELYQFWRNFNG